MTAYTRTTDHARIETGALAAIVQYCVGDGAFALQRSARPARMRATATVTA